MKPGVLLPWYGPTGAEEGYAARSILYRYRREDARRDLLRERLATAKKLKAKKLEERRRWRLLRCNGFWPR